MRAEETHLLDIFNGLLVQCGILNLVGVKAARLHVRVQFVQARSLLARAMKFVTHLVELREQVLLIAIQRLAFAANVLSTSQQLVRENNGESE